jgi:hypothetical protein
VHRLLRRPGLLRQRRQGSWLSSSCLDLLIWSAMRCGEAELFCVSMGEDHTTTPFIPGCVRRLGTRSAPALGGFCSMKVDDSTSHRADYRKTVAARRKAAGKYVDLFGEADGGGVAADRQNAALRGRWMAESRARAAIATDKNASRAIQGFTENQQVRWMLGSGDRGDRGRSALCLGN